MIPKEVFQKIRRVQIRSSHQVDDLLAGSWHSAFKGRGIEFEEVRPYQVGDDVRSIDWNVTARSDQPYVKLFREEREMSVLLLVDLSRSIDFGTANQTKREMVAELGATLAMSAVKNNDKVGLTLFTDGIEKAIPPRKGTRHVLRIIRELLYCRAVGIGTNIRNAIEHLNRTSKRRSVVFLISDFFDAGFEQVLRISRKRHDLIPVTINDPREKDLPNVGLIRLRDSETGQTMLVDTASRSNRDLYRELVAQKMEERLAMFRRLQMEPIQLETGADIVDPLRNYFHGRERK
ncbi:MAG: DUF58 domain-containing protein [Planctomycetota bacterium]